MMGIVHSDVCPFCNEQLQVKTLSEEEQKDYMQEFEIKTGPASEMYDLSKVLK